MLRKLSPLVFVLFSLSTIAHAEDGQANIKLGEGVRQNTTLFTFDSYRMTHYAANSKRELSPQVARSLSLTMLAEWGTFFTKAKMVDALHQALEVNTSADEFTRLNSEISRFKKTLLMLPINNGSELNFKYTPETGLEIQMKGPRGFLTVFKSSDQKFAMSIFAIWLGKAHPDANNRGSLERLIEDLWRNAR